MDAEEDAVMDTILRLQSLAITQWLTPGSCLASAPPAVSKDPITIAT